MAMRTNKRKSMRLRDYDYSQQGVYFVTICSYKKLHVFGEITDGEMILNDMGRAVVNTLETLPQRFPGIDVDAYVVMPNHVHGILAIITNSGPDQQDRRKMLLSKAVGYMKMNAAKRINSMLQRRGVPVWQRNYYERILRDQYELDSVRDYIATNPMRWAEDSER